MIIFYQKQKKMIHNIQINLKNIQTNQKCQFPQAFQSMFEEHLQYIQHQINQNKQDKEFMYQYVMYLTHQLKTPLASLQLMIEKQSHLYQFDHHSLEKQVNKMTHTISSLLNQGKLEAGKVEMKIERNELNELIDSVQEDIHEMLLDKNIYFQINYDNQDIYYDAYWLKEALCNILKNCIEHSKYGQSIVMNIQIDTDILIKIQDHAGGLKHHEHIFERYHTTHQQSGVGLGLYLSQLIITQHFGHIDIISQDDGTCFEIYLPYHMIV